MLERHPRARAGHDEYPLYRRIQPKETGFYGIKFTARRDVEYDLSVDTYADTMDLAAIDGECGEVLKFKE